MENKFSLQSVTLFSHSISFISIFYKNESSTYRVYLKFSYSLDVLVLPMNIIGTFSKRSLFFLG